MKRWTALTGNFRLQQRWMSHDKSQLTREALLKQIEAGLGKDVHGNPLRVDADAKKVSTAVGDLPISPIMDPSWIKSRRRQTKNDPMRPTGRFRRKLTNNPYALALITPMRRCCNTEAVLPRYFFQDFELLKHPDPKQTDPWFAPGPLSFEDVVPYHRPMPSENPDQENGEQLANEDGIETTADTAEPETKSLDTAESEPVKALDTIEPAETRRPRRAPLTSYVLNRKAVLDLIGAKNRRYVVKVISRRQGSAMTFRLDQPVWRPDMGDLLLRMLRRRAVDGLIHRGKRSPGPYYKFVQPCANWDAAKEVKLRGCVLWMPKETKGLNQYATLDVEGAKYGAKMAVHDLTWLLGEEEVQRLRDSAEVFRESDILVLKQWRTDSMIKLHQLLWRLQGYLSEDKPISSKTSSPEIDED